jgi:hypothetical protein
MKRVEILVAHTQPKPDEYRVCPHCGGRIFWCGDCYSPTCDLFYCVDCHSRVADAYIPERWVKEENPKTLTDIIALIAKFPDEYNTWTDDDEV